MGIHSFIDVITNSSATTYMYPSDSAVEDIKKIFDILLIEIEKKYDIDLSNVNLEDREFLELKNDGSKLTVIINGRDISDYYKYLFEAD